MPMTLAHPAVVVPLAKLGRFASLSALVIGTMLPDLLNYGTRGFWDLYQSRAFSHSFWPGACGAAVVLGWPIWLFFQAVLKRPLAALLPGKVYRYALGLPRFGPLSQARGGEFLLQVVVISVSLAVGASSHLVWDMFTHEHTVVGQVFPLLDKKLMTISNYEPHVYTLVQHGSTLAGLTMLAWWSWRWLHREPPLPADFQPPLTVGERVGVAGSLVFASCTAGVVMGLTRASGRIDLGWLRDFAGPAVVTTLFTWAALLATYAVVWSLADLGNRPVQSFDQEN